MMSDFGLRSANGRFNCPDNDCSHCYGAAFAIK